MKQNKLAICLLTITSIGLTGCGEAPTPEASAQTYYQHLCAGQTEKARDMFEPQFRALLGDDVALEVLRTEGKFCQEKGGLKSFGIQKKEDINESRVLFTVAVEFKNGTKEMTTIAMRPVDGKWYASAH